jgi:hypothetical protein
MTSTDLFDTKHWLEVQPRRKVDHGEAYVATLINDDERHILEKQGFKQQFRARIDNIANSTKYRLEVPVSAIPHDASIKKITPPALYDTLIADIPPRPAEDAAAELKTHRMQKIATAREYEDLLIWSHNAKHMHRDAQQRIHLPIPNALGHAASKYFPPDNVILVPKLRTETHDSYVQTYIVTDDTKLKEVFGNPPRVPPHHVIEAGETIRHIRSGKEAAVGSD